MFHFCELYCSLLFWGAIMKHCVYLDLDFSIVKPMLPLGVQQDFLNSWFVKNLDSIRKTKEILVLPADVGPDHSLGVSRL